MDAEEWIRSLQLDASPSDRRDPLARKLRIDAAQARRPRLGRAMILLRDADAFCADDRVRRRWRIVEAGGQTLSRAEPPGPDALLLFRDELPGPVALGDLSLADAVELASCDSVEQIETPTRYRTT